MKRLMLCASLCAALLSVAAYAVPPPSMFAPGVNVAQAVIVHVADPAQKDVVEPTKQPRQRGGKAHTTPVPTIITPPPTPAPNAVFPQPVETGELLAYLKAGKLTADQCRLLMMGGIYQYEAAIAASLGKPELRQTVITSNEILVAMRSAVVSCPDPGNPFNK